MKKVWAFCIIAVFIIIAGLRQTAIDPESYTGYWYSPEDHSRYLFQNGLICCPKYEINISESDSITGAYVYCKNSILLFAEGVEGLEKEKELYLVHRGDGSFLCENADGSGAVYFIRYHN